jgi:hypothetical protein
MAFQMNYYHPPFDITFYNAYWRINPTNGIVGGKDGINYIIEVFCDAQKAYAENPEPLLRLTYFFVPDFNPDAPNIIAQAYSHARSLSLFNGSVDV